MKIKLKRFKNSPIKNSPIVCLILNIVCTIFYIKFCIFFLDTIVNIAIKMNTSIVVYVGLIAYFVISFGLGFISSKFKGLEDDYILEIKEFPEYYTIKKIKKGE